MVQHLPNRLHILPRKIASALAAKATIAMQSWWQATMQAHLPCVILTTVAQDLVLYALLRAKVAKFPHRFHHLILRPIHLQTPTLPLQPIISLPCLL